MSLIAISNPSKACKWFLLEEQRITSWLTLMHHFLLVLSIKYFGNRNRALKMLLCYFNEILHYKNSKLIFFILVYVRVFVESKLQMVSSQLNILESIQVEHRFSRLLPVLEVVFCGNVRL